MINARNIKALRLFLTVWFMAGLIIPAVAFAVADKAGSRDHSLFTRMSGFYIEEYRNQFDAVTYTYLVGEDDWKDEVVEGRLTQVEYRLEEGARAPSSFQIIKNYTNAMEKLGGKVLFKDQAVCTMKLEKGSRVVWVKVEAFDDGQGYSLFVSEVGEMAQDVTAGSLLETLNTAGHVTVYIQFSSGQAVILPESQAALSEIVAMMKNAQTLALRVEGHTDNVGDSASNVALSKARAEAVVQALADAGIDVGRLTAAGFGESRPIGDNGTEAGRRQNRRVELHKK